MSLLEDRITRILELRQLGKSTEEISEDLGLAAGIVDSYEAVLKRNIGRFGRNQTAAAVDALSISPLLVETAYATYGITGEDRIEIIQRGIQEGLSQAEIARLVNGAQSYVSAYLGITGQCDIW
ncbi:MAG: hypothetical protein AABW87_03095, partial [Nanoarchaeota archaeon]